MRAHRRYLVWLALVLLGGFGLDPPVHAQDALNDTGVTTCFDDSAATGSEPSTHPRQDCRMGRDAANGAGVLAKTGGGAAGFDFTKFSNGGVALPASATLGTSPTSWACTYDNTTGLMWEVKSATANTLRYDGDTYTWYDTDSTSNGGFAGYPDAGHCKSGISCDTQSYVAAVNAAALCGHHDWRLPTIGELETLVDYGVPYEGSGPAIDTNYFPNTQQEAYWSATVSPGGGSAYYLYFNGGYAVTYYEDYVLYAMVVRSGQ